MTTKFMSATLVAAAAVFGLAYGTAFADGDRMQHPADGYAYPNYWATEPSAQQQSSAGAVHQADHASVGIYMYAPRAGCSRLQRSPKGFRTRFIDPSRGYD
jgi:hypothetical protein